MSNLLIVKDWTLKSGATQFRGDVGVLIAHLTPDDAYFVDVVPHGKGFGEVWGDKSHLETMLRNWPAVMERYELKGILAGDRERQFSALDYIKLREGGIMAPIVLGERVFMGPGMGVSTDGSSTLAVQRADYLRDELDSGEQLFRTHYPVGPACLFIGKDASVGYFIAGENKAFCVIPGRNSNSHVTGFLKRLQEETGILERIPDGSIWTATANLGNTP